MASPFDYAWMLLKARPLNPSRDFGEETSAADELDPDIHEKEPEFLQGTAPDPDLEEPAAMAPDSEKPPTGQSQDEALEALFTQFPHLRDQFTGGAPDEPV